MPHKIITGPSSEVFTLEEAKARLVIDDAHSDINITPYIVSARLQAERYMQRSLITRTIELALDAFPDEIELPFGPVKDITSIKYIDPDGVEQTIAPANYWLDDYGLDHKVHRASGYSWPSTQDAANVVKVRYVAGYGDDGTAVPQDIQDALLVAIGHWVHFKKETESGNGPSRMPKQFYDLLDGYRITRF